VSQGFEGVGIYFFENTKEALQERLRENFYLLKFERDLYCCGARQG
jgi:hypothetical protein